MATPHERMILQSFERQVQELDGAPQSSRAELFGFTRQQYNDALKGTRGIPLARLMDGLLAWEKATGRTVTMVICPHAAPVVTISGSSKG